MEKGRIIIITGSPGTGKTTISSILAKESTLKKSVNIHTDDFYHYLSKGAIPPYLPESDKQNATVIKAIIEATKCFAQNGYDVIVDGIIGPWFLNPWIEIIQNNYEIHYFILRASKEETLKRAVNRPKLDENSNIKLVEIMWEQFSNLGFYEKNIIDTTNYSIEETVLNIQKKFKEKNYILK